MGRFDPVSRRPPQNPPPTPRSLVHEAARRLEEAGVHFGHGTDNALDEAVVLVFHVLGLPFEVPEEALDQPVAGADAGRVEELLQARIRRRVPAAYLTGEAWFCGLPFCVDPRVLVPRSPIAELIEAHFSPWIQSSRVRRILDLGTGSGCIAIAAALAFPEARVDAVDLSPDALEVAARNVARHEVQERVRLLAGDLFAALSAADRYDVIVSNPPYVDRAELEAMPEEYHREPLLGLAAGGEGLDVAECLLRGAAAHLEEEGILVVEVGASQGALEARYPQVPFFWFEFERGGEGVFMLSAEDLRRHFPA